MLAGVRDLGEHVPYDAVAQSHAKLEDDNLVVAVDLHKSGKLFELGCCEDIWMSETLLVNGCAYAPLRFENAFFVETCTRKVSIDIARDHEGVGVLRKMQ